MLTHTRASCRACDGDGDPVIGVEATVRLDNPPLISLSVVKVNVIICYRGADEGVSSVTLEKRQATPRGPKLRSVLYSIVVKSQE